MGRECHPAWFHKGIFLLLYFYYYTIPTPRMVSLPIMGEGRGEGLLYIFLGSVTTPVIADAATTNGLARMVRAPGP